MSKVLDQRNRFFPTLDEVPKIYIIHESDEWVAPLLVELGLINAPFESWYLNDGAFDLSVLPPEGIFYNRMSASAHTRGHRFAVELTVPFIQWLESHGRRVINGSQTLALEVSKALQYSLLRATGIKIPRTLVANNREQLLHLSTQLEGDPFIVKPNRGGKGLGVKLYHSPEALQNELDQLDSIDGIYLLQEYIRPVDNYIVRMEFIGGKFYYAVRVDTSEGFELCPADACSVEDAFCPTTENGKASKFSIIENFENPDIQEIETFLQANTIDIAGIEYLTDRDGQRYVYDINTNTNYSSEAEAGTDYHWKGMRAVAKYLSNQFGLIYT